MIGLLAGRGDAAEPGPGAAGTVTPLRRLSATATRVVEGTVAGTETFDEGRLHVYRLRVDRALRGAEPGDETAIVELRAGTKRPPLLADGRRVLLLLRPAPSLSYLAQHLPPGPHWEVAGGRDGVLEPASDAEREEIAWVLDAGPRIAALPEREQRAARRELAFRELASRSPRLAADAAIELSGIQPLEAFSAAEIGMLGRSLADTGIPASTRAALVRLIAAGGRREALPALRTAAVDTPELLRTVLTARGRLGAAPTPEELAPHLAAKDPAIRAAAVEALAALEMPPLKDISRYATGDPEPQVRVAAIEALGAAKKPEALPTLAQTLAASDRDVRQASGRAILAIGGDAASDTLVNLALHGADSETRKYATVLLLVSGGRDSAAVRRLEASNPSGEVEHILEHGFEMGHKHDAPH